ncbi:unnamed protein product [Adineta steineri]|uniref:Oxysterol-binding protein n=1 Tax=Adineta steineri TaxID=433720 RepID=A0A814GFI3_9BILA|nr:unnamed protein product [Adineta steineri]
MKRKGKDDLSLCCVSHRCNSDDDDDSKDVNKQTTKVPNIPTAIMESPTHSLDSKENLSNINGIRQQTLPKQTSSRLDRSLSRHKDDNDTSIIRSSTVSSFTEQAKPDELASGLVTMGLLNDDDMNKLNTTFESLGNSLSAILDGAARLTLLSRGEDYVITMPYANCKGILIGKLTMELGGKVTIVCEKTRYSADIEFKLKPFIGGQELTNHIEGKIRLEKDVIYTFSGHWDDEITMVEKATNTKSVFWKVSQSVVNSRLKRYVVPIEQQQDNESEKLWQRVTIAIKQNDQISATEEKTIIEDEQRRQIKERKATSTEWHPRLFNIDSNTKEWIYTYADARPWDAHNDISTYENNFVICTRTRHRAHNMNNTNKSSSRSNLTINPVRQTSTLARGPSPSLNNIHDDHSQSITPTNINQTSLFKSKLTDDSTAILKHLETTLNRINERLDTHEKDLNLLKTNRAKNESNQFSYILPYTQYILIIIVAIILKYIFQ